MNLAGLLFIKVPRKLFHSVFDKIEYLHYRLFFVRPKSLVIPKTLACYFLRDEHAKISELFRKQFSYRLEEKIKEADLICEHVFDLLGSGPKKLSKEGQNYQNIDWHSDFKSGYQWAPETFFRSVRYGHQEGVDIKIPWELSRFQHLIILGQAYLLSKDEKYVQEFINQVTDWIKHNPVGFGVNWYCSIDAAMRVVNWLVTLEYFSESNSLSSEFLRKLYLSIYEHGVFIRNHLETKPVRTNHYLADIAGLFFISVYCPFFKESKKWRMFCLKELEKEIQHQVYPDGCDFEGSTSYHRLALEMFFYCGLLAQRSGETFSDSYRARLKKMFEFSLYCVKPNGAIPQIGDNDNARFLVFSKCPVLEHKYLLILAAVYYQNPGFKMPDFKFDEEAFWVFGKEAARIFQNLSSRKDLLGSKAFPNAGWYIMRHENDYCFVSCGPNGQDGIGGHAHNDKLSFELMLDGEDVIVDPGSYNYTAYPGWRNRFRSTGFHNTVNLENIEQNNITSSLFALGSGVDFKVNRFEDKSRHIIFEGEISYIFNGCKHLRVIILDKLNRSVEIVDEIISPTGINCAIVFCLPPNYKEPKVTTRLGVFGKESGSYSAEYGIKTQTVFLLNKLSDRRSFKNAVVISSE